MSVATLNASYPAAVSTDIDYAMLNQRIAQVQQSELVAQREAQIAANIAERIDGVGTAETAANVAGLGTIALPTGAIAQAQKTFVQDRIVDVAVKTGNQLPQGFATQLAKEGAKEAGVDISAKAIQKASEEVGFEMTKKAAQEVAKGNLAETASTIAKSTAEQNAKNLTAQAIKTSAYKVAMDGGAPVAQELANEALKDGIQHGVVDASKASLLAKVAPHAGTVATTAIAVGGAVIEKHKSEQQLIGMYADDLKSKLGVDVKDAKVDDLKKLVETSPAEYDALRQEIEKGYLDKAAVGAGGSVAGGAVGTMAGAAAGTAVAAGATVVFPPAIAASPFIVKAGAFAGGVAGSMVTSNSVQTWYKQCTGQDTETCIDALRNLETKLSYGDKVNSLDVVKVIVGDDKRFDAAVQKLNGQGKKLHEMSPEMQFNLIAKEFPELNHSATFLAEEINSGKLDNLASLTKINTQVAASENGVAYVASVVEQDKQLKLENAINSVDYNSSDIEPQQAQIASRSQAANRSIGQGQQGGWAATVSSNAEQSQLQQYAR